MGKIKIKSSHDIFMVDDNEIDFLILNKFIKKSKLNNRLKYFGSGEEFIHYIRQNAQNLANNMPALVLMDINMTGLDGYETIDIVRKIDGFGEQPLFCMLTSSDLPSDTYKSEKTIGFIVKPINPEEYITIFNSFVDEQAKI